jgi:predicted DNA binding CopG/RHH family protein
MNKPIPEFKNEDEERDFWAENDSSEYVDWSKAQHAVFPNLKPSTRAISLRLPEAMLAELRQLANQRDVPYQSLIKVFLRERIDMEHRKHLVHEFAVREERAKYTTKK